MISEIADTKTVFFLSFSPFLKIDVSKTKRLIIKQPKRITLVPIVANIKVVIIYIIKNMTFLSFNNSYTNGNSKTIIADISLPE